MDLGTFAARFSGVRWLGDLKFQGHCPCPTHSDGDPELSLLARLDGNSILVGCFGGVGDTADSILTAVGLTEADLLITHSLPPKAPAAAFSENGVPAHPSDTPMALNGTNGHPKPRDFGSWQLELGYQIKGMFDQLPENQREILASMEKNQLIDEVVRDVEPHLPALPEGLSETELDEEVRRLADKAVVVFQNAYLPELPAVDEIDREPIDAYEAYQMIQAAPRDYSWGGLIRYACTLVLTALIGAGKTTLAMNLVRGWALGGEVLGRLCKQSKSLVVVSPKEYEAWCDTIGFWGLRGLIFIIPSHKTHFESGSEQARWFEITMKKYDCRTFVLDTLFDFFGMPPNTRGDSNRIALAEQTPLLEVVRANAWSGLVTGHAPKSEAQAVVARDPEEAFGGHTAWTAQHRMRAVIRRKAKGASGQVSSFLTGRGGFGDTGILDENMLLFDESTRLVTLGGKFAEYLGETALPSIQEALAGGGSWMSRSDMIKATGKSKNWVYAGVKYGLKTDAIKWNGKGSRSAKYALPDEPNEVEQGTFGI